MPLESITLAGAIKGATPIAQKLFKAKIAPLVDAKIGQYLKGKAAIKKFEKDSTKYIAQLVGKCSMVNTIAFQNSPKKLDDLYIPLTLDDENIEKRIKVDRITNIFVDHHHILVTDSAGMGKSILSKRIILNAIDQGEFVPVFIELRELEDKPIEEQVAERFGVKHDSPIDFLQNIPLLYVFDGLDEVPTNIQKAVVNYLSSFSETFLNSKILITSRQETFLSKFYRFKRYSICRLVRKEAYNLISKCDPSGEISKKLIAGISNSADRGINEFLTTPLYVSLLFCAYRHKTIIPQKKHLFYSQVYDALFEAHDLSKDVGYVRKKYSNLDSAEFHSVLRRLGFWCLKNSGKIEFQKDELEIILTEIIENISGIETSSSNFTKDIISTVPVFMRDGATIRWSHKSLMEYFASMFICNDVKSRQSDLLLHFFNSKGWSSYHNVFELCADIDYGSFRASILKEVLEKFIEYNEQSYNLIKNSRISDQLIVNRIAMTFSHKDIFSVYNNTDHKKNRLLVGKKMENFRKIIHEDNDNENYHGRRTSIHVSEACLIDILSLYSREYMILMIIAQKSPHLFLKISEHTYVKINNICESSLMNKTIHAIGDSPKLLVNNSANFEIVNNILALLEPKALDKEQVEKEINLINTDNSDGVKSLLDGLL